LGKKAANLKVDMKPLEDLQRKSPEIFFEALKAAAIQFLTWANTGSGGTSESRKPPIRFGVLRGSSSAFVNGQLVQVYPQSIKAGAEETPSPARSGAPKDVSTTWVWNTDYASKMHEWSGGWGKFTSQDGDAGNKWAEKHVDADKELWLKVVTAEFKKRSGL
jgi:hypothetical protein